MWSSISKHFIQGLLLQTHLNSLVPLVLIMYVQINGRIFEFVDLGVGSSNILWTLYALNCEYSADSVNPILLLSKILSCQFRLNIFLTYEYWNMVFCNKWRLMFLTKVLSYFCCIMLIHHNNHLIKMEKRNSWLWVLWNRFPWY